MGLLSDILTFPVSGPSHAVRFVLEQIRTEVDRQRLDPASIQKKLLALNERLNAGLISEETFEAEEAELLKELDAIEEEIAARATADESIDEALAVDTQLQETDDGSEER